MYFYNVPEDIIEHYDKMLSEHGFIQREDRGNTGGGGQYNGDHLRWMLSQINTFDDITKAHRWLGFIQGALICYYYLTTVEKEREFTRGRFYNYGD